MSQARTARLGRATAVMAVGTFLSRVTGMLRLLVAVYALGIGHLSDAFNLANNTPNIVHDLVLGGVLSATFVPVFVDRMTHRTKDQAADTISAVMTLATVILVVSTVGFVVLAPYIIDLYAAGTHSAGIAAERTVATDLLRLFAPQLLGYGAISLMTALLNSVRKFAVPAYVPILNNLIAIAILFEFRAAYHSPLKHGDPSVGAVAGDHRLLLLLGLGTTAGVIAQAIALVPSAFRAGVRVRWHWDPRNDGVREIASLSGWTFGFVLANQVAVFVTLALAVHYGGGSGAATAYTNAFTFFQLPYGMIAVSVMTAVMPELASHWSRSERADMSRQFGLGLRRTMAIIWPAAFGYLVLAGPLMKLLLVNAPSGGVRLTGQMLAFLALGLPGFCVYLLAIGGLQAMRDTRTAFLLYLLENTINVVLNFVLVGIIGPKGLALAFSIAYTASAFVALFVVRRRMGGIGGRTVLRFTSRSLVLSVLMAFAVAVTSVAVGTDHGIGLLLRVCASVAVGLVVYGAGASLAGTATGWQTANERRGAAGKGT